MRFYTRYPGSVIRVHVMREGANLLEEICFPGRMLETGAYKGDPLLQKAVEKYLSGLVDKPGTGISDKSDTDVDAEVQQMVADKMMADAEKARQRVLAAGEKVT